MWSECQSLNVFIRKPTRNKPLTHSTNQTKPLRSKVGEHSWIDSDIPLITAAVAELAQWTVRQNCQRTSSQLKFLWRSVQCSLSRRYTEFDASFDLIVSRYCAPVSIQLSSIARCSDGVWLRKTHEYRVRVRFTWNFQLN